MSARVLAVDLGGTKLSVAIVDDRGAILDRRKAPVDKAAVVDQIGHLARDLGGAAAAGLIVPGIYFAETGEIWAPNLFGHQRVPFREQLQARLGFPVTIDSDRAGYVLGEQWLGAARGLRDVVFLAVGTGIGAGILAGGRLIRGAQDIAGAVGWFALDPRFQDDYRAMGCWEAEAAGPALARRYGARSAEEVAAAARAGDAAALRVIQETAAWLAMGVANIVSILNPEMIVLGGGLMQAGDLLLDPIRRRMPDWAQPVAARSVRIELSALGEDAGLLGAARIALDSQKRLPQHQSRQAPLP